MLIRVIGAGVAGLTAAYEFARAGCNVELVDRAAGPGLGCSFFAGGMIAPWCEAESAEPLIVTLGIEALDYWTRIVPVAKTCGSIVVAQPRDRVDLNRFARMTQEREALDKVGLAALEPDLGDQFDTALYFPREAHLEPRAAMARLAAFLAECDNVQMHFNTDANDLMTGPDWTIDCRGLAARDVLTDLRGVKGEMLVLATDDITLSRPVRMVHPRRPVYIVPRGDGRFMVGATMIENDERGRVTARSMMELLGSAYALHPAFGEAEIIETGSDVRPSFHDNLPRLRQFGRTLYINGFYRHGFLLAPALARMAAAVVLQGAHFPEVMDANPRQRQTA